MRIAFLLKGAISKVSGKSSFPKALYQKGDYVNFTSGALSIKKHIVEANPENTFDFFFHSWHPDLHTELLSLYNPVIGVSEDNNEYKDIILQILRSTKQPEQFYGQVSMCLSFKKVTELLQAHVNSSGAKYDLVIFYRYDLLLWKDMVLSEYLPSKIYVNGDSKEQAVGDFHFVMNYDNAITFGTQLYDSISLENPPRDHRVIKKFVQTKMNKELTLDSIIAGEHQEVIRKLILLLNNKISINTIASFGLTEQELKTYNIG